MSESPSGGFEQHTAEVYGWAYRLLGRHHDALDVVQDVFLRWNAQCRGADVPQQPRGWLRRVTLNRAIDVKRARREGSELTGDAVEALKAPQGISVGVDRETLRDDITLALDRLTDVQRCVLVAKVYDEMTFAQIAAELGSGLSTVKTHYLRAVRAVRDRLTPRWEQETL